MLKLNDEFFSIGRAKYFDSPATGGESTAKVYVKIQPNDLEIPLTAQLDTGSPWSILEKEIAESTGLLPATGMKVTIQSRLGTIPGWLVRTRILMLADKGESLAVDATVFVSEEWPGGTFIGYGGLLERIRIALDPVSNDFYFGPVP